LRYCYVLGESDRNDVSRATFNFNLKDGFYLRSSATWNFDLESGNYSIPVGLRIGKVFQVDDKVSMNAFVEPQCTVFDHGNSNPEWQMSASTSSFRWGSNPATSS
jgi:hypothetical protein